MTRISNGYMQGSLDNVDDDGSDNETPYHARENALPFSYLECPKDNPVIDSPTPSKKIPKHCARAHHGSLPVTPTVARRLLRPNIPTSRPVLQKTPTRQEFEKMLEERLTHVLADQRTQLAQYASIQDDLDELHKRLNKQVISSASQDEVDKIERGNDKLIAATGNFSNNLLEMVPYKEKALSSGDLREWEEGKSVNSYSLQPSKVRQFEACTPPTQRRESSGSLYTCTEGNSPYFNRRGAASRTSSKERSPALHIPIQNMDHQLMAFTRDSSEFWYKPCMSRQHAVDILEKEKPGTFIIRKSTSYKNAYGLVLRVPEQQNQAQNSSLVKHFLIEPTARGVHLKGSVREPVFTSLSAFVYQHSIEPMALPCTLIIPDDDLKLSEDGESELLETQKHLLEIGAACNVWFLFSMSTESLTGDEAIRQTVSKMRQMSPPPVPVEVHFKVSPSGITLTDNKRLLYFRQHYAAHSISYIALDPEGHTFELSFGTMEQQSYTSKQQIFAFVARSTKGNRDNLCHVFCDFVHTQPASAIVSFAQKVLPVKNNLNSEG